MNWEDRGNRLERSEAQAEYEALMIHRTGDNAESDGGMGWGVDDL